MQVPALETNSLAIRFWRGVPTGESAERDISYFDLQVRPFLPGTSLLCSQSYFLLMLFSYSYVFSWLCFSRCAATHSLKFKW